MSTSAPKLHPSRLLLYALGVFLVIALSLGVFYLVMHPPMRETGLMALFLSITAAISILVGFGVYRLGWIVQAPSLRWAILGGYFLASLLTFLNVWVTARLMFTSPHDLLLATILLLFASGIAIALGLFLSSTLTERIYVIDQAASAIAEGDRGVRVPVQGRDELTSLANTFNEMAARLQAAERKQQELEVLRRDLIAWVSHDLQTPLASIRAIVEAVADGMVEDPETIQRYLSTAQRDIRALSALIDDLFQMAQLDAGGLTLNLETDSLSDLISDTLESFSELAARQSVTLQGQVEPGVSLVFMDTQRIGRVLNNLVGNALRYTPAGGKVQVRAAPEPSDYLVEVWDTGEGIPPADLPFIFERFYRSEKSRNRLTGGAGLGLAIARGIIEAHGGQIGVESTSGQGARFWFTLPKGNQS
jgi:signal transduction histidine kinase